MKLLALAIGLAAATYAGCLAFNSAGRISSGPSIQPAPLQLENARQAARRIEADALERAAEAARPFEGR